MIAHSCRLCGAPLTRSLVDLGETPLANAYPTREQAYNAIYDVKHQVPLWTREPRSKSWYAAGWYQVRQGRSWQVEFCPKLITLQRYAYRGPYYTEEQAHVKSV
jgi:hypothetical protein